MQHVYTCISELRKLGNLTINPIESGFNLASSCHQSFVTIPIEGRLSEDSKFPLCIMRVTLNIKIYMAGLRSSVGRELLLWSAIVSSGEVAPIPMIS